MASATFHQTKDKGMEALDKVKDAGATAVDKAKEAGAETFGKVKESSAEVLDKARDAAGAVGNMATETATAVGRKADDLTAAAGHQVREFGETIGRRGSHEGMAGQASQVVADAIKGGGQYIEEAKLSGMARDVEGVIRNHPIPALLVCFGVGYCLGRALKD